MNLTSSSIDQPIFFIRQGVGQPVLLIHGIAASHADWEGLSSELVKAGFEAIALDLPGHGNSGMPEKPDLINLEIVFDTLVEWIRTLKLTTPPFFVGHSLGGYLALEYALHFPEQTRGMVLIDPYYSPFQIPYLVRVGYRENLIFAAARRKIPDRFYDLLVETTSFLNPGRYVLRHDLPQYVRRQMAENFRRASPGIFKLPFTARNLEPYLSQIHSPTLVIYGTRDSTLRPRSFGNLVTHLSHAQGIGIKAGHVPHQSNADETNRTILDFFKKLV